jgi:hypothetical protein
VTVNPGFEFVGWAGTGPGAYSGPVAQQSVKVTGPIREVASFAPVVSSTVQKVSANSLWTAPTTWIGLGIVGLLIGLVLGLMFGRRRGGTPPGQAPESVGAPSGAAETDQPVPPEGGSSS